MKTEYKQTEASRELSLYSVNDHEVYTNAVQPVIRNLAKKLNAGIFDNDKARKAFANVALFAAKKYARDFGGVYYKIFSAEDRRLAGVDLFNYFVEDIIEESEEMASKS